MSNRRRASIPRPRRSWAEPATGELWQLVGTSGETSELVAHLEHLAAAAAEQGVEFRAVIAAESVWHA